MKKMIDVDLAGKRSAAITLDARQINCYNEFFGCEESESEKASREIREGRQAAKMGAIGALIGLSGCALTIAAFLMRLL